MTACKNISSVTLPALLLLTVSACGGGGTVDPSGVTDGNQDNGALQNDPGNQSGGSGANFGLDIPAFQDILLVYRIDYSTVIVSIDQDPVMIFDDGSATLDLTGVLANGINASQQDEPIKWGRWSGDAAANTLELGFGTRPLTEVEAALVSESPAAGTKLNGCYTSTSFITIPGASLDGSGSSLRLNEFCFQSDGIFSNETSNSTITPALVGSSAQDTAGYYEIDGNAIQFTYGNGTVRHHLFGLYSNSTETRFAVSIDNKIFTLPLP